MLHLKNLSKNYGSKVLFSNAEAHLTGRERVALIGPNGAGKSTLIRIILGQETQDSGEVIIHKNNKVGHLAQELPKFDDRTLIDEVMRLDGRREEILKQKMDLEKELETDHSESMLQAYSRVLEEFDAFDEYRLPSRAEQILEGVGFQKKDFHRNLNEFSGGWLMRAALARVLLLQPELLILDEPTNHLDLESLLWLEEFLKNYPGALLLVSHDRAFLNRLVDQVWEIDQNKINPYSGNLDSYIIQKEERLKVLEAQFEGQQQKIAEIEAFVARFGAKATKARQAQSRLKQLEKMDRIELPESRAKVQFTFPPCQPSGKEVLTVKKAAIHFGEKKVFSHLDWILQRGSRVGIVGVNGAGKTTLLKVLSQHLKLSEGTIKIGHNVALGYYSQMQAESLNLEHTIIEELESTAPHLTISQVRGIAGAFLFSGDDVQKKIRVLSGGEKARVALAKLLLLPHNFLLLDEPTNHLDTDSKAVLLEALSEYAGTLCLVSHDRDFVAPLVTSLLEIKDGQVIPLVINYEEYLAKKIQETRDRIQGPRSSVRPPKKSTEAESPVDTTTENLSPKKPSPNQIRNWQNEFKKLEQEIAQIETRQGEINRRLAEENFEASPQALRELIEEQTKNQKNIEEKLFRWEELCIKLG